MQPAGGGCPQRRRPPVLRHHDHPRRGALQRTLDPESRTDRTRPTLRSGTLLEQGTRAGSRAPRRPRSRSRRRGGLAQAPPVPPRRIPPRGSARGMRRAHRSRRRSPPRSRRGSRGALPPRPGHGTRTVDHPPRRAVPSQYTRVAPPMAVGLRPHGLAARTGWDRRTPSEDTRGWACAGRQRGLRSDSHPAATLHPLGERPAQLRARLLLLWHAGDLPAPARPAPPERPTP